MWKKVFYPLWSVILLAYLWLSLDFGISWDEWTHVIYGKDILSYLASFGADKSVFDLSQHARESHLLYGASFDTLAAALQRLSPLGLYETRHLLNALNGALILLFTGLLAKKMGSWPAAVLALLFLAISPRFMGHAMNNPKDIPFALGYTAAVYFLVSLVEKLPKISAANALGLVLAIAYAISIRIGGVLLVVYLFFAIALYLASPFHQLKISLQKKANQKLLLQTLGIAVAAYFLGIAFWPYAHLNPIGNPIKALVEFSDFSQLLAYEIFEGERFFVGNPPKHYLFKWIAISLPIYFFLGWASLAVQGYIHRFALEKVQLQRYLVLLLTLLFPLFFLMINGSALYSGWRHVLFVHPLLAVLAALGVTGLLQTIKNRAFRWGYGFVLLILMVLPLRWMWANHPHQLVYFNELVGGTEGAYGKYETDYWGISMRAGVNQLAALLPNRQDSVIVATNFEPETAIYYAQKAQLPLKFLWVKETERYRHRWDYALFGSRTFSPAALEGIYPPASTVAQIMADGAPLLAVVKRGEDHLPTAYEMQEKGDYQAALNHTTEAMKADPAQVIEAMRLTAIVLIVSRQAKAAIPLLENALAIDPADYIVHTVLGLAHKETGNAQAAAQQFLKAIDLRKNYANAYLQLGNLFTEIKEEEKAVLAYKRGIQYTNSPVLYLQLGKLYFANNPKQAEKALLQAVKGAKERKEATALLKQLSERKGN